MLEIVCVIHPAVIRVPLATKDILVTQATQDVLEALE